MTIPNATIKYGLGVTYIKNSGTYKPLVNLLVKTDSVTWTPVKTGWICHNDGTWERIYPTPKGIFTPNVSSLTYNTYKYYQSQPQVIQVTNTGDYDLVINSIVAYDSVNNYTTSNINLNGLSYPVTITPTQSVNIPVTMYGNTVGSGFTGNLTFNNYIGYFGSNTQVIPITVNVQADYPGATITPSAPSITYYLLDSVPTVTFTIKNSGNGGNLVINSISTQSSLVSISGISTPVTVRGTFAFSGFNTTFTGNTTTFVGTIANLSVGTYADTIYVDTNAGNIKVPVNISVITPNGLQAYDTPGTYMWQVPDHVHRINLLSVGGGGSGGAGLSNSLALQGGGGGGGGSGSASVDYNVTVTPGETLSITVGKGGTFSNQGSLRYYPVSLSYAWSSFMNSYAVWTYPDGVSPVGISIYSSRIFTASYSGNYTFEVQADNHVRVYVDGTQVISSDDFHSSTTGTVYMSQGTHTLGFSALNDGGPAGFAMTIKDTGNNILWTTRTNLDVSTGTSGISTTVTGSFGTVTVSGGGAGGAAYDDGAQPSSGYSDPFGGGNTGGV